MFKLFIGLQLALERGYVVLHVQVCDYLSMPIYNLCIQLLNKF